MLYKSEINFVAYILYRAYTSKTTFPANTKRSPNAGLMLAHYLRRWTNISPALGQRLVFTGLPTDLYDKYR